MKSPCAKIETTPMNSAIPFSINPLETPTFCESYFIMATGSLAEPCPFSEKSEGSRDTAIQHQLDNHKLARTGIVRCAKEGVKRLEWRIRSCCGARDLQLQPNHNSGGGTGPADPAVAGPIFSRLTTLTYKNVYIRFKPQQLGS